MQSGLFRFVLALALVAGYVVFLLPGPEETRWAQTELVPIIIIGIGAALYLRREIIIYSRVREYLSQGWMRLLLYVGLTAMPILTGGVWILLLVRNVGKVWDVDDVWMFGAASSLLLVSCDVVRHYLLIKPAAQGSADHSRTKD